MNDDIPTMRFDELNEAVLMAWSETRMRNLEGWGLRGKVGAQRLGFGRDGSIVWAGPLGGAVLLLGSEIALVAAGHGLPLWALILCGPAASRAVRSVHGMLAPWNRSRGEGAGILKSFGSVCRGVALRLRANVPPNLHTAPLLVYSIGATLLESTRKALAPSGTVQMGSLAQKAGMLAGKLWRAGDAIHNGPWQACEDRKSSLRLEAHSMAPADVAGHEAYSRLAIAYFKHLFMLDGFGKLIGDERMRELLTPREWLVRERHRPLLEAASANKASLLESLDLAERAGTPPWWRPKGLNQLPTLAELAEKVRFVLGTKSLAPDPELDRRIKGLLACCEGRLISQAAPEAIQPATLRPRRL